MVLIEEDTAVYEESSDVEFVCGDPQVEPRVGDEFQVEIPPMLSESKRALFLSTPVSFDDSSSSFLIGLPDGDDNVDMNQSLKSLKAKKGRCSTKIRGKCDKNLETKKQSSSLEAVPTMQSSYWEDYEVASFVLGLYTFGKNFTEVKKFMENKGTGEIVLFYYGKFYNSAKYHSWSETRKKRNRKCVNGRKLYSGWRQQQLLSRLMPSITDESQKKMLVDVSKSFAEGNITLERYVSTMKDLVGLRLLVEAVAIGKDKEDLTLLTAAPVKTKPWFKLSSDPGEGTYNSLTSADIINQLTGCSRLSKARTSDIFWGAVWPRLLARGWNSEQPEDRGYFKSKDYIVFLVPGVKKFSRQKLVKGEHYFDSISDILTKVTSEPELLEFETGGEIREATAENLIVTENSSDQSDKESSPPKRYLRSPSSNHGTLGMKFTVVDTSLAAGGEKLCGLRRPSAVLSLVSEPKTRLGEREKDSSAPKRSLETQNVRKSRVRPPEAKKQVDEPMRFTVIDTSVDCTNFSGLRRWRQLPSDDKSAYAETDSGIKEEKTLEKVKDKSKRSIKNRSTTRAETNYQSENSAAHLKRRRLSACISRESLLFKELPGDDDTKRTSCLESEQQDVCAVQHQSSTCELMNQDKEAYETVLSVEHDEPKKTETEPSPLFVEIQETSEINPRELNSISSVDKHCSLEKIETAQELNWSGQEPNKLCSVSVSDREVASNDMKEKQAIGAPSVSASDINRCPSSDLGTTQELSSSEPNKLSSVSGSDKKASNDLEQKQAIAAPSISGSNIDTRPSSDLGTTQKLCSSEQQQINTDGPRRQSTRKRPLTTRALEALESSFFTTKPEPKKRKTSTKKKLSAKACNRNGNADSDRIGEARRSTSPTSKPLDELEDSKSSYLLNETRPECKTLDQTQDSKSVLTEFPKRPRIILKLPIRRG